MWMIKGLNSSSFFFFLGMIRKGKNHVFRPLVNLESVCYSTLQHLNTCRSRQSTGAPALRLLYKHGVR